MSVSVSPSSPSSQDDAPRCPVDHSNMSQEAWERLAKHHPPTHQPTLAQPIFSPLPPTSPPSSPAPLACDSTTMASSLVPPPSSSSSHHLVGDVFPDSTRSPHQRVPLSTSPIPSSIPRSGVDPATSQPHSTWVFPSPQRFFNAMTKKGWQPQERDMVSVVSIHNTVNEQTWRRVLQWETLHGRECGDVKLARFKGRPNDASVKARVRGWMGYVAPFDRHDWYVDRCGKEVRYIIDFYAGQEEEQGVPSGMKAAAIHIDARPALDSPGAAYDRLRMQFRQWL